MAWSKVNGQCSTVSAGDDLDSKHHQSSVFQDVIAWSGVSFSPSASGHAEAIQTRITSPDFFNMLGLPLVPVRDFVSDQGQVGEDHVLTVTHLLPRERFGRNAPIIASISG
jgi:hypothetical protein